MTRHYLTDEDLKVLNGGDSDAIKRHVNALRGELVETQATVKAAVKQTEPAARACALRKAGAAHYYPEGID
jgi:hypothetical protein